MMKKGSIITYNGLDAKGVKITKADEIRKILMKKGFHTNVVFLSTFKCKVVAEKL